MGTLRCEFHNLSTDCHRVVQLWILYARLEGLADKWLLISHIELLSATDFYSTNGQIWSRSASFAHLFVIRPFCLLLSSFYTQKWNRKIHNLGKSWPRSFLIPVLFSKFKFHVETIKWPQISCLFWKFFDTPSSHFTLLDYPNYFLDDSRWVSILFLCKVTA